MPRSKSIDINNVISVVGSILLFLLLIAFTIQIKQCIKRPLLDQTFALTNSNEILYYTEIASDLFVPWEIIWGPDDWIWFSQRDGHIKKLNPESGKIVDLLHLKDNFEWTSSGTLGMVLHPDFSTHPFLYVVYTYSPEGTQEDIKGRLVRYTYNSDSQKLTDPAIFIDSLPYGLSGMYGSRLHITEDKKLLMTTGGMWHLSTDTTSLLGKVLRIELEDGSIPDDNPIDSSYVYSWGHRNPQGLTQSDLGIIYSSEHGPTTDDEINIIEPRGNYGWPFVLAECNKDEEKLYCDTVNVTEPLHSWYLTIAPAGLIYYNHPYIKGMKNSLLQVSLKERDLRVLHLSDDGTKVRSEDIYLDRVMGRIRDICISPDGKIYLSTSHFERQWDILEPDPNSTSFDKIFEIGVVPR